MTTKNGLPVWHPDNHELQLAMNPSVRKKKARLAARVEQERQAIADLAAGVKGRPDAGTLA